MLKLEKMQLSGFKSFSDRTELQFPDGITAVVGPNGCGKSNIGDAINWVLGEQSAKMLRGSSMQDVIFNGSEARKPVGLAEVSLHLRGVNGEASRGPVVVTRRLFRAEATGGQNQKLPLPSSPGKPRQSPGMPSCSFPASSTART